MPQLVISTAAEQVAAYLRAELFRGVWTRAMPGGDKLAAELGIGSNTAEAALALLEKEGLLQNQGRRRGRIVIARPGVGDVPPLRVAILLNDAVDVRLDYMVELRHELIEAGHAAVFAPKAMAALGMDATRILRMMEGMEADAWVVFGGSTALLEGVVAGGTPAFALFGRRRNKRMAGAGPDKRAAYAEATRRLAELGHRRIVLLTRATRRMPVPGLPEQAFLNELAKQGLPVSSYNLPDWKETPEGFRARLEELFRVSPPTALILDETPFYFAAQQYLARRRLRVPDDVSLVCTDESPDFGWCRPPVARIRWDSRPLIRRIVKWAANISHGKEDLIQTDTPAEFVPGGTMGPASQ
jgi:DNA-binding LacI/PurR family transcriptional regulator